MKTLQNLDLRFRKALLIKVEFPLKLGWMTGQYHRYLINDVCKKTSTSKVCWCKIVQILIFYP